MQGKIMFVLGAAAGYVVGTRTGRQGYERLKKQANDFWHNPKVQNTVSQAEDFAREKLPVVGYKLNSTVKKHVAHSNADAETSRPSGNSASAATEEFPPPSNQDGTSNG